MALQTYIHYCKGTCSRQIEITYDNETLKLENISFLGGCNGNLKGIAALCKNKTLDEVALILKDIKCGFKQTSN